MRPLPLPCSEDEAAEICRLFKATVRRPRQPAPCCCSRCHGACILLLLLVLPPPLLLLSVLWLPAPIKCLTRCAVDLAFSGQGLEDDLDKFVAEKQ